MSLGSNHVLAIGVVEWLQMGNGIDREALDDEFGHSVSLSSNGSILAIGARYNDGGGFNSGHTRVYSYNGADWGQIGSDINGEAASDYSGYSVSLSSDGSILAIGAPYNDGGGPSSGHTRVYSYNGADWDQIGSDINGETADDLSGYSVSLSSAGSILAIGAKSNGCRSVYKYGCAYIGHTRVYSYNGADWDQIGSDIDGEAAGDYSGYSVSLSSDGSILAIGALYNDGGGSNSGHTRVYSYNGADWDQIGSDINGEAAYDYSGYSVSLSSDGSILAIGAIGGTGYVRCWQMMDSIISTQSSMISTQSDREDEDSIGSEKVGPILWIVSGVIAGVICIFIIVAQQTNTACAMQTVIIAPSAPPLEDNNRSHSDFDKSVELQDTKGEAIEEVPTYDAGNENAIPAQNEVKEDEKIKKSLTNTADSIQTVIIASSAPLLEDNDRSHSDLDKSVELQDTKGEAIEEEIPTYDAVNENAIPAVWCIVCMDRMRCYACVPCGHLCLCQNCTELLNGTCPICRQEYTSFMKIYK